MDWEGDKEQMSRGPIEGQQSSKWGSVVISCQADAVMPAVTMGQASESEADDLFQTLEMGSSMTQTSAMIYHFYIPKTDNNYDLRNQLLHYW